jgi:hypothetical protein
MSEPANKWQKREHYRHPYTPDSYAEKKAYRHASTSLGFAGIAGHMLRTGGILAPLIISEFVKDPEKKWKAIRLSAIAAAILSEALYAQHYAKGKQTSEAEHEERDEDLENRLRDTIANCGMASGMGMGS